MKKQYIYIIIILVILLLSGIYLLSRGTGVKKPSETGNNATTTVVQGGKVDTIDSSIIKDVTVKTKDSKGVITSKTMSYGDYVKWTKTNLTVPPFETISKIPASYPEAARKLITDKFTTAIADLKTDQYGFDKWLNLGSVRQLAEDYTGAEEAYLFATQLSPQNSVAFYNLGYLYGYYLHNNAKAEVNYLKAVENQPQQVFLYFQISDFYRDVIKDLSKARAIIEQGIKANPSSATDLNTRLWALQDPIKK